ncbi:hydrolase 76 protein, partial [Ceratobasidium sp. 395]
WWEAGASKNTPYKNAVTNEQFIAASATVYLKTKNATYLNDAVTAWNFLRDHMRRPSNYPTQPGLYSDGTRLPDCANNGDQTWTYNQGVVLHALGLLYKATGNHTYVDEALVTLDAIIKSKLQNGVLAESCDLPNTTACDADQVGFKGLFMRHLQYFLELVNDPAINSKYADWIGLQARAMNQYARRADGMISQLWWGTDNSRAIYPPSVNAFSSGVDAILTSIKRFDRRPKSKNAGEILAAGFFNTSKIEADDEIEVVEPGAWPSLEQATKCEVDLDLEGNMDILTILSACYGISRDASAHNYALFQFNCYFFSWTILAVVARHKVPTSIPRKVGYTTILRGSSWSINKVIWTMPMPVLRFAMQNIMKIALHHFLEPRLQAQLLSQLAPRLRSTLESRLHAQLIPANIHDSLWLSDVRKLVDDAIRTEISNTLWDIGWDAVGNTGSDVSPLEVAQEQIPNGRCTGPAQFRAMYNAAMYAALPAMHRSAKGRLTDSKTTREDILNEAWFAGRDAALVAAQAVVQATAHYFNSPARDVMWSKAWEVWNEVWGASQARARETILASVDTMIDSLIDIVVEAIVLEVGSSNHRLSPDEKPQLQSSMVESMTHDELQRHLQKLIRASSREQDSITISTTMGRVWKTSRSVLVTI